MNSERWERVKSLYDAALDVEPGRREAFLREACGGDESLLEEVRSLLAQDGKSEDVLDSPPFEVAAKALAEEEADGPPENLTGRTLSHYRLEEKIGQGGMGVVYRAFDTILERAVALKILPAAFASDKDRMLRFIREAKAASALSHPNVATIHEVAEAEGVHFIVMEYVSGQTLSEYSRKRRLEPGTIIDIGIQMADALDEAHAKGIIHRDLKPGNVMLTARGQAKVLDFGLAKLVRPAGEAGESSISSITDVGLVMGTVPYMSPEQVLGHQSDNRTDIFSLGTVLYELATGQAAFAGRTTTETMDRVLHAQPSAIARFNHKAPAELERIVRKCLEKDRELRYQHASDLCADLKRLKRDTESVTRPPETRKAGRNPLLSVSLRLATVVVTVVSLIAAGWWYWSGRRVRSQLEPPAAAVPLTSYPGWEYAPSFSPDGNSVAFEWKPEGPGETSDIYIKQVGVEPPSRLTTNPEKDFSPAWSPDGRFIAFLRRFSSSGAKLMLIPLLGGQERVLEELDWTDWNPFVEWLTFLCWTPDSKWLVVSSKLGQETVGLLLVSVETQEKRKLTTPPAGFLDCAPAFSPDGRTLGFTRTSGLTSRICLLRLGRNYEPQREPPIYMTPEEEAHHGTAWLPDGSDIVFGSGTFSGSGLWRMTASVPAKPVRCAFSDATHTSAPAVSRQGNRLVYSAGKWETNIYRVDLSGPSRNPRTPRKFIGSTRLDRFPAYSPDGRKIAFSSDRAGSMDIWVCDPDGSNAVQLTSLGSDYVAGPKWSPDGRRLVFALYAGGEQQISVINASGGAPQRLAAGPLQGAAWPSWSRNGQSIYFRSERSGHSEIWKMPATGGEPIQITRNTGDLAEESPDGKFLYYRKDNHYPAQCSLWRKPTGGGEETRVIESTSCLGAYAVYEKGIYFLTPSDRQGLRDINLYDFSTGKTQTILTVAQPFAMYIAVSPDGRTILYEQPDQAGSDLMMVENFH